MTYSDIKIDYIRIGKRVSDRRRDLGISQSEFASRLGISNNYLSSIERGRKKPTLEIWLAICENLNISTEYLFSGLPTLDPDEEILKKIRACSFESQELISEMLDVFVKRDNEK